MHTRATYWAAGLLGVLFLLASVNAASAQAQEIPLGSEMPMANRAMPRAGGSQLSLAGAAGNRGAVVVFWSNQCPWVDKYEDRLFDLVDTYGGQDIGFVLVNSNDPTAFPQESAQESAARNYPVPYLMDQGSALARAFGASRTPHVFVFDGNQTLVYVGTVDDSPGDPGSVQKTYLADALRALVQGNNIGVPQTKAFGCTIKFQNAGG